MKEIESAELYNLGDKVKLLGTGNTYSTFDKLTEMNIFYQYVHRYKPINAQLLPRNHMGSIVYSIRIKSGYLSNEDLAKRGDLKWKVRFKYTIDIHTNCGGQVKYIPFTYVAISSNENHLLICNDRAIEKLSI